MDAKERATEFVRKYPNQFTGDHDWWIAEIGKMILEAEIAQVKEDEQMTLRVLGKVNA